MESWQNTAEALAPVEDVLAGSETQFFTPD